MSIIIGADFVPTDSNIDFFVTANAEQLLGEELQKIIKEADLRIFNLEMPLTNTEEAIQKCGPNLKANPASISLYTHLNINLLTLANNHILDYGERGLKDTLELLSNNNIHIVGAGDDIVNASRTFFYSGKKKIGVYACSENEFSIATNNTCGANPYDPLITYDDIENSKNKCDYLIVLYHGGKEHYRYPSPELQKRCRKMVEKGADIVVCQHSHCIGCEEKYLSGTIIYGQGNFLFDDSESEFWQTSLLIHIDDDFEMKYIPLCKQNNTVRLAETNDKNVIMEGFYRRSREVLDESKVKRIYHEFSLENLYSYLLSFMAVNRESFCYKVMYKLTKGRWDKMLVDRKYKKRNLLSILNFIECEAHSELLVDAIKSAINHK